MQWHAQIENREQLHNFTIHQSHISGVVVADSTDLDICMAATSTAVLCYRGKMSRLCEKVCQSGHATGKV